MTAAARDQHLNGTAASEGAGGRPPGWDPGFGLITGNVSGSHRPDEATQQVDTPGTGSDLPDPSQESPAQDNPAQDGPAGANGAPLERVAPASAPGASGRGVPGGGEVELSSARRARAVRRAPRSGWRAAVFAASGGLINPGESETDRRRRELSDQVAQRLVGCYRIAALSVKGGVGKTTTTMGLGSAFASLRGDRVIALDANPDRGNLVEKVSCETAATVRHLLDDADRIQSAADVRAYTSQNPARLEILASESDPEMSEAFNDRDYRAAIDLLSHHYNILLTDCGTGLLHSALTAAVEVADCLLVITTASIDGARAAEATLNTLEAHGHRDLVARSVTVINQVPARASRSLDLDVVERSFAARTRAVVQIPYDPHLDEGDEIDLEQLSPGTRDALLELAAVVAADFTRPGRIEGGARRRTSAVLPGRTDPTARRRA